MFAFLLPLIVRLGVPERWQKAASTAMSIGAAIIALALLWAFLGHLVARHDDKVISADRMGANLDISNRQTVADREAGAAMARRDKTFANDQQQAKDQADEAARNDSSPLDALFNVLR